MTTHRQQAKYPRARWAKTLAVTLVLLCATAVCSASAWAVAPGTGWEATSLAYPTNLPPGGTGKVMVYLVNTGAMPSTGSITVTDTLPSGLTATKAGGLGFFGQVLSREEEEEDFEGARWSCGGTKIVTCTSNPTFLAHLPITSVTPEVAERIAIEVEVAPSASEGTVPNGVTVAGGGAAGAATTSDLVTIGTAQPSFGFAGWNVSFSNADGTVDTQAGSHPYEATIALGFNALASGGLAGGDARNLEAELPPGFFGDPNAVPQCTRAQLDGQQCPAQSQIGVDEFYEDEQGGPGFHVQLPIYNMVPPRGVPDEFAFSIFGFHAFFDAGVRSGDGYPIVEHIDNLPTVNVEENILTLWGVPAEESHNAQRDAVDCDEGCASGITPKPFLTLPTSCEGPQAFTLRGLATWNNPDAPAETVSPTHEATGAPTGFTGCEHLSMAPSLSVTPDTSFADTPAGLTVEVKVPQEALTVPHGLVASTIKNTTVTLPEGVVINPGQAAGLVACQAAEANVHGEGPSSCPAASKVGTVHIRTPLLEGAFESELEGEVYVLQSNPPDLQLLLSASADGVYLKLVGDVHLNETTGRLTTTFAETPSLPYTDLKLSFSGGAQAALATPTACGSYTTTSDFTPWAAPLAEDVFPTSTFPIISGPGGSACASPLPFKPELIAGSTTDQAGGFTNFSLLLRRGDGQQRIERLQFKAPPGLSGMLSTVSLCPEPQASKGECSESSKIGHAAVASGPGPYPLTIPQPGNPESPIYITGPYDGAPFGLSIVTHVIAGPFNLGTIVTRAKIEVDPNTAQITVTTEPLPQIVAGVPTDLRLIDSVIDRPGFMFNPTNCNPSSFSGTAWGTPPPGAGGPGASAPIESHFQVGSCRSLEFKPGFAVSTSGETSRTDGASLHVDLIYPSGSFGKDANVAKVKVALPKQLPARLTTLQKACTEQAFDANPASCPADSVVGHAKAITPLVPVPLEGPAYFVSHGGAKFPELIIVLQGYGITLDLHGETYINKSGITSSTFATVPDAPVGSFELTLPEGPDSALAANGDLCTSNLAMPTEFIAQNGAEIHESTPISVSGCEAAVTVVGHSVKGAHANIRVTVPSAGTLVATGGDVDRSVRRAAKAGTVTIGVTLAGHGRRVLAKNPHQRVNAKVKLSFTPEHGAPLTAYVRLLIG
jgi:uncharacterized repeat protein (TIGR01451 family)